LDKMQNSMDSHETWEESVGSEELKKDITKKMIEKAHGETIKSRGTVPSNFSDWLELHTTKSEVNWRQVLRKITGNKRVGKRSTIMRKNRRFPNRPDLRGTTKNRTFDVLVIADVSGSMDAHAISSGVSEVKHVCDVTQSDINLIQIDTAASEPEKISANTKIFTRKSSGGTTLFPAIEKAREHNLDFQAIIIITDGGLSVDDISKFASLKKKIIWLVEEQGRIMTEMNSGLMQAFQLQGSSK
jgi:predicted metal-dependent peptidase